MSDGFGFGDGGLLGDIDPPAPVGVVRKGPSVESKHAHSAWSVWAKETGRPDSSETNQKFYRAYLEQLRLGRDHAYLLDVVRGAARLPVNAKNQDDTRRVINALRTLSTGRTAVSALHSGQPVVPYPFGDNAELKSSIADLAQSCRIPPSEWGERDQEAAGILIETLTPDALEDAATDASHALGMDGVLPTDVLRASRSSRVTRGGGASFQKARETYSSGVAERKRFKEVAFPLDDMAKKMLYDGVAESEIIRVHQLAPEGYWDAVFDLAVDGDSNDEAYRRLADQFDGWHPDQRS